MATIFSLQKPSPADHPDKYLRHLFGTSAMRLMEIIDFDVQQRNVERMKQNAKKQSEQAKAAQARLKMLKAQQQINSSTPTP